MRLFLSLPVPWEVGALLEDLQIDLPAGETVTLVVARKVR